MLQADEIDVQVGGASSSQSPMEAEGSGVEGFNDLSKRLDADKADSRMSSSPDQIAAVEDKEQAMVPLDEVLKGLIISQIRGPFVLVPEGIVNLIKDCVLADLAADYSFFSQAALSGYVDHFQSVDDEDLGWGCGWRNIQILGSFLLAEDTETRELLFNGAGFVPDIPALQLWLEIAWSNGFDEPGAKYFNWSIAGTRKWIGTTECAALLRSFGVRAKIVSFTALGGKRVRNKTVHKPGSFIDLSDGEGNETSEVLTESVEKIDTAGQTESTNSRGGAGSPGETESTNSRGGGGSPGETESTNSRGGAGSPGGTESTKSRSGALTCDDCGMICEQGTRYRGIVDKDSNLCDDCMQVESQRGGGGDARDFTAEKHDSIDARLDPITPDISSERHIKLSTLDLEHDWNLQCDGCGEPLRERRYKSLMRKNFDICAKCMKGIEDNPQEKGSTEKFVIIEEFPAIRCYGPPVEGEEQGKDGFGLLREDVEKEKERVREVEKREGKILRIFNDEQTARKCGGNGDERDIVNGKNQKTPNLDAKQKSGGKCSGYEPISNEERGKAGMGRTVTRAVNHDIDHHHLIEWVWSYFTDDSARRFSRSSTNSREVVLMSKRAPVYFQHRGHSRTIVGIERRRKPGGFSEDVYLLVLDPSLSTELLAKSLREKSGWHQLIKNDVQTLKEAEYQLCYVDPGIATGEELEQLKVLSSLRYSYY